MTPTAFLQMSSSQFDERVLNTIAEEVAAVERELEDRVFSKVPMVREVGELTLRAGGKRLRPALVTLSAQATGLDFSKERTRRLAACMEMIHMATLIHDDVIDKAPTRRGVETAASKFGNTASILSGDVLLSKAMAILADDGDLRIIRNVAKAVVDLAEGEVQELAARGRFDLPMSEHKQILTRKTATFIQSCCEVGAYAAGADEQTVRALGSYGYHLGMAFQMADDLLDYRGNEKRTGKSKGTDFREGCATLPLILLLDKLSDEEREVVRSKFGNGVTEDELRMIGHWMESRGVYALAEQTAQCEVLAGVEAIQALPETEAKRMLESIAAFVVTRPA